MNTVLIVDDLAALREQYAYDLARLGGFRTLVAASGEEALETLRQETVDCLVLDLEMPGLDGFDVLDALRRSGSSVPVIVYTGTGNFDRCVRAVRMGAYGFIDKSEPTERVVREIQNALERGRLAGEVRALRHRAGLDTPLVGESPSMRALREQIGRLADIPSPVLISGESGTGKELVARELHRASLRREGPYVALNCAALPENLIESELFGHERGAFTGADRARKGAFESAASGTLFLDEVAELPLAAQAKMLRALEEQKIMRLGSTREIPVDARVLAASHRDLEARAAAGLFREDLLYRLNVHVLQVPALRERLSDIPILVETLAGGPASRPGHPARGPLARESDGGRADRGAGHVTRAEVRVGAPHRARGAGSAWVADHAHRRSFGAHGPLQPDQDHAPARSQALTRSPGSAHAISRERTMPAPLPLTGADG